MPINNQDFPEIPPSGEIPPAKEPDWKKEFPPTPMTPDTGPGNGPPILETEILNGLTFEKAREAFRTSEGKDAAAEAAFDAYIQGKAETVNQINKIFTGVLNVHAKGDYDDAARRLKQGLKDIEVGIEGVPDLNYTANDKGLATYLLEARIAEFEAKGDEEIYNIGELGSVARNVIREYDLFLNEDDFLALKQLTHAGVITQGRMDEIFKREPVVAPQTSIQIDRISHVRNIIRNGETQTPEYMRRWETELNWLVGEGELTATERDRLLGSPTILPVEPGGAGEGKNGDGDGDGEQPVQPTAEAGYEDRVEVRMGALANRARSTPSVGASGAESAALVQAAEAMTLFVVSTQEGRLSTNQEYREFMWDERWGGKQLPLFGAENAPRYYATRSEKDQELMRYRVELLRAVNYKRTSAPNMEFLEKNADMKGLSKTEIAALYKMNGVKQSLEIYMDLIDTPRDTIVTRSSDGSDVRFDQCKDRDDVDLFRDMVVVRVAEAIEANVRREFQTSGRIDSLQHEGKQEAEINEIIRGVAEFRAKEAEQVAFNLHYIANTFELGDPKWEPLGDGRMIRRERPVLMAGELVSPPLKNVFNSLDALVDRTLKDESSRKPIGGFTDWAVARVEIALNSVGAERFDEVVVVPEDRQGKRLWWTAENVNGRVRLYIPDCYPHRLVGSMWDETKLGGRRISEYLRDKEEVPWNAPEAQNITGDYLTSCKALGETWKYFQGPYGDSRDGTAINVSSVGKSKQVTAQDELRPFVHGLTKNLAELGLRKNERLIRWAFYCAAAKNIDLTKNYPMLKINPGDQTTLQRALGYRQKYGLQLIHEDKLFFEWNAPNWFTRLST